MVRAYTEMKSSGRCNGILRYTPSRYLACNRWEEKIADGINETHMLNIRARYDLVSAGTGEAFGKTVVIEVPTHFRFDGTERLGSAIGQGAAALATQT